MAKIIARCQNQDGKYHLSIRVYKKNVINNAIPLNVVLSKNDWLATERVLMNAEEAEKSGNAIAFRDVLVSRLWKIKKEIEAALADGDFDVKAARKYVRSLQLPEVPEQLKRDGSAGGAGALSFKEFVCKFIADCESGERLKAKSAKKMADSTIRNFKGTLAQIEAYEAVRHTRLDWEDITMDFYDNWRKFFLKKGYSPNTIGRHVKNLKIWLYAAKEMKLTKTTDFETSRFAVVSEEVDNIYLTEERIRQMYEFNPTDHDAVKRLIDKAPEGERRQLELMTRSAAGRRNLEVAKDVFIVGCLTGQRVSDYKRISKDMFKTLRDGNTYIYLQQDKTKKWIYIPLDSRVEVILEKYGGRFPKVYDQHINEKIKIVGRLLGWCEDAGINELHGVVSAPSGKKFYECIKTHTARRSFATNAYKNGVALSSIMAVTGHGSEQMLRKYLKLDNKERAILAAQDFMRVRRA